MILSSKLTLIHHVYCKISSECPFTSSKSDLSLNACLASTRFFFFACSAEQLNKRTYLTEIKYTHI